MRSTRTPLVPGGTLLGHRLDQLRDALGDITVRLRSTVANAIGQTLGTVVRDAVLRVLTTLQEPLPLSTSPRSSSWRDRTRDEDDWPGREDAGLWSADSEQFEEWDGEQVRPSTQPEPARLTVAIGVGLEAAWATHRFFGKRSLLSLLGVGLVAGTVAYLTPVVAVAGLGLLRSATQLHLIRKTLHHCHRS